MEKDVVQTIAPGVVLEIISPLDGTVIRTASKAAAEHYIKAVEAYLALKGPLVAELNRARDLDPNFILANALLCALYAFANVDKSNKDMQNFLQPLENVPSYAGKRDIAISRAAVHLSRGQLTEAAILLRPLLDSNCHDMVVLKLLSDIYFYQGASHQIKALVDLDEWSDALARDPKLERCFGYALGARAFGLLEIGELDLGRKSAEDALRINPEDIWSMHAMSHYYEMSSDYRAAIEWARGVESFWNPPQGDGLLSVHMWWHLALFYVGDNDIDTALTIYQENIKGKSLLMDLADASSLLWRVELRGRSIHQAWWNEVATLWVSSLKISNELSPNTYPFNLIHAALALPKSSDPLHSVTSANVLRQILKFIKESEERPLMEQSCLHANALATRNVVLGVQAFVHQDYAECFRLLHYIAGQLQLMGGSTPQRAIFRMICQEAARRLNK